MSRSRRAKSGEPRACSERYRTCTRLCSRASFATSRRRPQGARALRVERTGCMTARRHRRGRVPSLERVTRSNTIAMGIATTTPKKIVVGTPSATPGSRFKIRAVMNRPPTHPRIATTVARHRPRWIPRTRALIHPIAAIQGMTRKTNSRILTVMLTVMCSSRSGPRNRARYRFASGVDGDEDDADCAECPVTPSRDRTGARVR